MSRKKELDLLKASRSRHYLEQIEVSAFVTGKALAVYKVPRVLEFSCEFQKKACKECPVHIKKEAGHKKVLMYLRPDNPCFVKFIGVPESNMTAMVKEALGIVKDRCKIKFTKHSVYSLEEVYLTEIQVEKTASYVSRVGYTIDEVLECNVPYRMECYQAAEPRQNKMVFIIKEANKLMIDADSYKDTPENHKILRIFQGHDSTAHDINEFLAKLYDIYANSVTKIYSRSDLHLAIDLVFHSPLQFYFNKEFVHKGWLDVLVIGDTRCGKGFVSENLVKYYGVGEILSAENVSFAGLVGGLQQLNGKWVVTWGKIPLNNRKLVVIDESGEMDPKEFARLSRIRSEGIAEITKIQTERAPAMTRLVFLSNPRSRMMSTYTFGIEAVKELVTNPEDIARFDYVLVVSQDEVNIQEINRIREQQKNPYVYADPFLIQWVWSRKPEQVEFTEECTQFIMEQSIKLANFYSPSIPLVQGENIRIKLAKISAAVAGRLYSTDKYGEKLVVKKEHVMFAVSFINQIYKKVSCGYSAYSHGQHQYETIDDAQGLTKFLNSFENRNDILNFLLQNTYINVADISECINQPKEESREFLSILIHHRCLMKRRYGYVKTKAFTKYLKTGQAE